MVDNDFEYFLLETLSFYEKMTLQQIILDLNSSKLKKFPTMTLNDLENALNIMKKEGKVKTLKRGKEILYLRVIPQRSWWRKLIFRFF